MYQGVVNKGRKNRQKQKSHQSFGKHCISRRQKKKGGGEGEKMEGTPIMELE